MQKEIESLIAEYSTEAYKGTSEGFLANYLAECMRRYRDLVIDREEWFGRTRGPAYGEPEPVLIPRTLDLRENIRPDFDVELANTGQCKLAK